MTAQPTTETATILRPALPVFRAVVRTVVPEAKALDDTGWSELEALVEESLLGRPRGLQRRLRLFLLLLQWLPILRYGRRFTGLDSRRRARFLSGLQHHRSDLSRVGFWGLRTLALLGYYGRGAAAQAIGYHPDPRGWEAS
jgi:hypothetical protein